MPLLTLEEVGAAKMPGIAYIDVREVHGFGVGEMGYSVLVTLRKMETKMHKDEHVPQTRKPANSVLRTVSCHISVGSQCPSHKREN